MLHGLTWLHSVSRYLGGFKDSTLYSTAGKGLSFMCGKSRGAPGRCPLYPAPRAVRNATPGRQLVTLESLEHQQSQQPFRNSSTGVFTTVPSPPSGCLDGTLGGSRIHECVLNTKVNLQIKAQSKFALHCVLRLPVSTSPEVKRRDSGDQIQNSDSSPECATVQEGSRRQRTEYRLPGSSGALGIQRAPQACTLVTSSQMPQCSAATDPAEDHGSQGEAPEKDGLALPCSYVQALPSCPVPVAASVYPQRRERGHIPCPK